MRRFDRTVRFTLALAVAVATPVAALFYFQFRSLADLERAYAVVLVQRSAAVANTLHDRLDNEGLASIPRAVRQERDEGMPDRFPDVQVAILDQRGPVAYQTSAFDPDVFLHERQTARWRIRTGYGVQSIAAITQASTGRQRNILVTLVILMSAGVFFVARAAGRELRLAEMKSSFVASVSHDLKTPLALIQLFAETLELGRVKSPDRVQEYYRIINGEARKLTRLINNLLDFSRIDAGLRQYRPVPTDLGELTRRVVASLGSQLQQAEFRVATDIDPTIPPIAVDPEAVQQALENLLSNAMKFSNDDRQIAVALHRTRDAVELKVIDRGIGIAPRHHRRIFRKFYRVESNDPFAPPGTGLGLAIVDDIMRGHNGSVRVTSEPGRGSTFALRFPLGSEVMVHAAAEDPGDRRRAADAARIA